MLSRNSARIVLLGSIWMLLISVVYYLVGEPYISEISILSTLLISVCGFLVYIAYKPRKKK